MKPNDRQKEIDAFHELKRRGEQKNRELDERDISNNNYSRRLQSLISLDHLGQAIDSVIGKKKISAITVTITNVIIGTGTSSQSWQPEVLVRYPPDRGAVPS